MCSSRSFGHRAVVLAVFGSLTLSGCVAQASDIDKNPTSPGPSVASEVSAPPLALVVQNGRGDSTVIDLETGDESDLVGEAEAGELSAGDGRLVFHVTTVGSRSRVDVIDTGRWSAPHGDHFHYFLGEQREVGHVEGAGQPVIRSADLRTAIAFPRSGHVVVVSHDDIVDGRLGDLARIELAPNDDLLAVPHAGGVVVSAGDGRIAAWAADGQPVPGAEATCPGAADVASTRLGPVFTCADGAVLASGRGDAFALERIALPTGGPAPLLLEGRLGRPDVAGIAPDGVAWRLDTREQSWTLLPSDSALVRAVAFSDDHDLTLAVDRDGALRVLDAVGGVLAATAPLVAASVTDPASLDSLRLIVTADRAYLSGPREDTIFEIDFRDGARVTRTWPVTEPEFLHLVG